MATFYKKALNFFIVISLVLVSIKIIMPYAIKYYAEKRINQIPEYKVSIADVNLHLLKGSYILKDIELHKIKAQIPVPFLVQTK